jgi:hypothetical protein
MLTRRRFIAASAVLTAGPAIASSARPIDGWTLLDADGAPGAPLDSPHRRLGVLTRCGPAGEHPWFTPEWTMRHAAPHRRRCAVFTAIPPALFDGATTGGMIDWLQGQCRAGFEGVGLHNPAIALLDPRNQRLIEACEAMGMPLVMRRDAMRNHGGAGAGLPSCVVVNPPIVGA